MSGQLGDRRADESADRTTVTVIVPTRNEVANIGRCLDAILANTYPVLEVLVVDGGSTDGTITVVDRYSAASEGRVRLVHNPRRTVPSALNIGWREARGDIIVRVDGHAFVADDYIERVVANLADGAYAGTGGRKHPVSPTDVGKVIAAAMCSRWGVGGSRYHYATSQEESAHVPFGAYPRDVIEALGGWDERFTVNQDFEFDYRLRQAGHRILFDPRITCDWICSGTIGDLAHQYRRYGRGKFNVVRHHPESTSPRHILPPLGVIGLAGLAIVAATPRGRLARKVLGGYAALMLSSVLIGRARTLPPRWRPIFPVVVVTMHVSQGVGFLAGAVEAATRRTPFDPYKPRASVNIEPAGQVV